MAADNPTPVSGVPVMVSRETTGVQQGRLDRLIGRIEERIKSLEKNAMTYEKVDKALTGLRHSLEGEIVKGPAPEVIEAVLTDVKMMATKVELDTANKRIDAIQPPKFWQLVILVGGLISAVGGFLLKAQAEVSEVDKQVAVLKTQVETLSELLKQQGNLLGVLLRKGGP